MDQENDKLRDKSFLRRHWQRIAALSGCLVLILMIIIVSSFLTRPIHQPINVTPPSLSTQQVFHLQADTVPTPPQAQALPCTVNLSTWTGGSSDWKIHRGVLLNDGTKGWNSRSGPTVVAPCDVTSTTEWSSSNYAVETQIQVTGSQNKACFGITIRGNPAFNGWQGYKAGVGDCLGDFDRARVSGPDYLHDSQAINASFNPGTNVHTYRVEVADTTIKFFIDGKLVLDLTDTRYLTGSEIGLWSQNVQLLVTKFKVTAL